MTKEKELLFKEKHIKKIVRGEKTMTRRTHKYTLTVGKIYGIRSRYFEKSKEHIKITRKFQQRLGDITIEDIRKEGYETLDDFKRAWIEIYGKWDPEQLVWVYGFEKLASE